MQHQPSSDVGGVDGAPRGALAGLSFRLFEERTIIMLPGLRIRGRQDSQSFPEHAAITPEIAAILQRSPD